jgi:hypothetical protein
MNRKTLAASLILWLAAAGCAPRISNEDAVKKAIMDYLATRPGLNLSQMDVTITKVNVDGNRADADVSFKVKDGGPLTGMQMHYSLVREGDRWKVQSGPGGHPGSGSPPGGTTRQ